MKNKLFLALFLSILLLGCSKKQHIVTFMVDNEVYETVNVDNEAILEEIKAPSIDNLEFVGWYNGEEKFLFTDKITGDITLTAKYKQLENIEKVRITLEDDKYIDVELYRDIAPITVTNFLKLVDEGFYDGVCFHRIIKDFMVQTGGYYVEGTMIYNKDEVDKITGEFQNNTTKPYNNTLSHTLGVISMARYGNDYNSASGQFFICTKDSVFLDGDYASFGKVFGEESYTVLSELNLSTTQFIDNSLQDFPVPIVKIISIKRLP